MYRTPGVYIVEKNAFANSIVQVPTAIPVFIGYTEKAVRGRESLTDKPTRISSMAEFERFFGGAHLSGVVSEDNDSFAASLERYLLYPAMRLFFANGGGSCWIVSVGTYGASVSIYLL